MGVVFRARDTRLRRDVAKVLPRSSRRAKGEKGSVTGPAPASHDGPSVKGAGSPAAAHVDHNLGWISRSTTGLARVAISVIDEGSVSAYIGTAALGAGDADAVDGDLRQHSAHVDGRRRRADTCSRPPRRWSRASAGSALRARCSPMTRPGRLASRSSPPCCSRCAGSGCCPRTGTPSTPVHVNHAARPEDCRSPSVCRLEAIPKDRAARAHRPELECNNLRGRDSCNCLGIKTECTCVGRIC